MNEIEKAIEHLQGQNKYYESENDEYSKKCIAVNNVAIKALEEKLKKDNCGWCRIKGYERIEFYPIDDDGHALAKDHTVVSGIAKYCPMCGRKLEDVG